MFSKVLAAVTRRVSVARYRVLARRESFRNLRGCSGTKLLALCHGNIYRSPFVAEKLRSRITDDGFEVRSAGFYPKGGRTCHDSYVKLAREYGVELDRHRSSVVDKSLVDWADTIIIMDAHNRQQVAVFGSSVANKVIWLGAIRDAGPVDIVDPYGHPANLTGEIVRRMDGAVNALIKRLKERASHETSLPSP